MTPTRRTSSSSSSALGPGPGTLLAAVQAPPGSGVSVSAVAAEAQAWYQASPACARRTTRNRLAAVQSALTGDAATRSPPCRPARRGIPVDQAVLRREARGGREASPAGRGHDSSVAGDRRRLRLGPEPPTCGVPVNARPRPGRRLRLESMSRPGRRPWLGVLASMLAMFALVLAAVPADSATNAPPAVRAVGTARALGKVRAAACNPYASSLRPSGPPQVSAARSWRGSSPAVTSSRA